MRRPASLPQWLVSMECPACHTRGWWGPDPRPPAATIPSAPDPWCAGLGRAPPHPAPGHYLRGHCNPPPSPSLTFLLDPPWLLIPARLEFSAQLPADTRTSRASDGRGKPSGCGQGLGAAGRQRAGAVASPGRQVWGDFQAKPAHKSAHLCPRSQPLCSPNLAEEMPSAGCIQRPGHGTRGAGGESGGNRAEVPTDLPALDPSLHWAWRCTALVWPRGDERGQHEAPTGVEAPGPVPALWLPREPRGRRAALARGLGMAAGEAFRRHRRLGCKPKCPTELNTDVGRLHPVLDLC